MAEGGIWVGLDEALKHITGTVVKADAAAKFAVTRGAAVVEKQIKANFEGSHKKGAPHVGGDKPNIVTGTLRRSIRTEPVSKVGLGEYATRVGPTTVYGRAVELGYLGRRGYPYVGPVEDQSRIALENVGTDAWMRVRG